MKIKILSVMKSQKKRDINRVMRFQTDQEFQHKKIKSLNSKFSVQIFSTRIRGGKAFPTEKK